VQIQPSRHDVFNLTDAQPCQPKWCKPVYSAVSEVPVYFEERHSHGPLSLSRSTFTLTVHFRSHGPLSRPGPARSLERRQPAWPRAARGPARDAQGALAPVGRPVSPPQSQRARPPPRPPSYYVDTPRPSPRTNRTRRVPHPVPPRRGAEATGAYLPGFVRKSRGLAGPGALVLRARARACAARARLRRRRPLAPQVVSAPSWGEGRDVSS